VLLRHFLDSLELLDLLQFEIGLSKNQHFSLGRGVYSYKTYTTTPSRFRPSSAAAALAF